MGKGALVVLNDEVNAARDVTKTNTYRVETFRSNELGLLGYVDADKVAFYRTPMRRHTAHSEFDVRGLTRLPEVDILYSYVEPSTATIAALVAGGAQGIVVAGTGAGRLSTARARRLQAAAVGPGGVAAGRRALEPHRQRPRAAAGRDRRAGDGAGRQPVAAEGPHPADAGADQDPRPRRDPADVRRVLIRRGAPMIQRHAYVLAVPDLARSGAFYRDVARVRGPRDGRPRLATLREGRVPDHGRCLPRRAAGRQLGDHSYFAYLTVDDVDAYHARTVAAGTEVVKPMRNEPWGMREFGLRTVDGHRIMIGTRLTAG